MKTVIKLISAAVVLFICMLIADQGTFSIAVDGSDAIDFVSLGIFIFIVYFFVTIKTWSPKVKKEIITAIVIYCCFNVFMVYTNFGVMCIKRVPNNARLKACFSNILILQGALEMYNMDHIVMMKELDIPTLIKEKYLKIEISKPEPDCFYTMDLYSVVII